MESGKCARPRPDGAQGPDPDLGHYWDLLSKIRLSEAQAEDHKLNEKLMESRKNGL